MRILFIGPSLSGFEPDFSDILVRGPAMQGDIASAVLDGATAIGLVDGYFDAVAAPWHKEILFALASGVTMLGASSMGALRAAECASFGMRPIGSIAEAYYSGALDDDAAVALSHGPKELGYPPLTEPLVDVQPTLDKAYSLGLLSKAEHQHFWKAACRLHFKDRTDEAIFSGREASAALSAYREHRVNRKAEDALLLIAELRKCATVRSQGADIPQQSSLFAKQVLPELLSARKPEAVFTQPTSSDRRSCSLRAGSLPTVSDGLSAPILPLCPTVARQVGSSSIGRSAGGAVQLSADPAEEGRQAAAESGGGGDPVAAVEGLEDASKAGK